MIDNRRKPHPSIRPGFLRLPPERIAEVFAPGIVIFAILSVTFAAVGLFPFGPNSLSWCDMNQQVVPLLLQFRDIITSSDSIFFHMGNAGGTNFWGIFFFFLSSPFSLLVLFFPKDRIFEAMNILVAFKLSAAGITAMAAYRRIIPKIGFVPSLIISVFYAFCGFSLLFYQNLGWLDVLYLFPLLALGLYRLLTEKKILLYSIMLSLVILANYYLSFMVLLFIIFASFFFWINRKTGSGPLLLLFATLVSGLSTAVVWYPSFLQYLQSARTVSLFESLSRGSFVGPFETKALTLLASSILLTLIPLVLLHIRKKSISLKWFFLFLILLLPIVLEPVNKLWHTGNYQAFPARYAYIFAFVGLGLIGYYFTRSDYFHVTNSGDSEPLTGKFSGFLYTVFCSILAFVSSTYALYMMTDRKDQLHVYTVTLWADKSSFSYLLLAFIFFGLSFSVIVVFRHLRKISGSVFTVLFVFLMISELLFNTGIYLGYPSSHPERYRAVFDLERHISNKNEELYGSDHRIYRMKTREKYFDVNLLGGLGVPTLNTYTSLTSVDYLTMMKKLGFSSYWMEVSASQGTVFSDRLMANRYEIIANSDLRRLRSNQTILYSNDLYAIAQDPLVPGVAFVIEEDKISHIRNIPDDDRFAIQNTLFRSITGSDGDIFTMYDHTASVNLSIAQGQLTELKKADTSQASYLAYNIFVDQRQILYFDCFHEVSARLVEPINDSIRISVNGKILQNSYPNKKVNGILELGEFESESVFIELEILKNVRAQSFGVAGMDTNLMDQAFTKLHENKNIKTVYQRGNRMDVLLEKTSSDNYLFLTVAYAGNITATANETNELEVERIFDSWVAVRIPPGTTRVRFKFLPDGFVTGLIVSVLSVLIGIAVARFRERLRQCAGIRIAAKTSSYLFFIFTGALLIGVYLFPVIYKLLLILNITALP